MSTTATKPMTLAELVPSNFLEAAEFEQERVLTIKDWDVKEVGADKDLCGILYFEEVSKGLVVNKTKKRALLETYGNDLAKFVGKKVTLFATEVSYMGRMVPAIGMKIPKNV